MIHLLTEAKIARTLLVGMAPPSSCMFEPSLEMLPGMSIRESGKPNALREMNAAVACRLRAGPIECAAAALGF